MIWLDEEPSVLPRPGLGKRKQCLLPVSTAGAILIKPWRVTEVINLRNCCLCKASALWAAKSFRVGVGPEVALC